MKTNSTEVPQKTKIRVVIWSGNSTPEHISRQNYNLKRYMQSYIHNSIIHNSQDMETTQMSIDTWMDKENVIHIYNGILLGLSPAISSWIETRAGPSRLFALLLLIPHWWGRYRQERGLGVVLRATMVPGPPAFHNLPGKLGDADS